MGGLSPKENQVQGHCCFSSFLPELSTWLRTQIAGDIFLGGYFNYSDLQTYASRIRIITAQNQQILGESLVDETLHLFVSANRCMLF